MLSVCAKMAHQQPPKEAVLSPESLEFTLLLTRIEAWIRSISTSPPKELESSQGDDVADIASILRAKILAYEQTLVQRLTLCDDLDKDTAESFRSRIEDLGPMLRKSIEASAPEVVTGMATGSL